MAKKKKRGFGLDALKGADGDVFDDEIILDADAGAPDGSDARGHAELMAEMKAAELEALKAVVPPSPPPPMYGQAADEKPLKVVFKPHAESPYRDRISGARRRGRNEIVPSSIPTPPAPIPQMGEDPSRTIIVISQSKNRRYYQYSIIDVDDPSSVEGIGTSRYESEVYPRGSWGHGWKKAVRIFGKLRNKHLGIPGNIKR